MKPEQSPSYIEPTKQAVFLHALENNLFLWEVTDRISTHHGGFHDLLFLGIDEIVQDDFACPIPNAVHPGNPFHLILRFQLFRNALLLCQPRNKLLFHFLRLTVNFFQVGIECPFHQHSRIKPIMVFS